MERLPLDSKGITSVGYDEATSVLEIEFRTGHVYQYLAVPRSVYQDLLDAPSKGLYFKQEIKDRFEFRRIV